MKECKLGGARRYLSHGKPLWDGAYEGILTKRKPLRTKAKDINGGSSARKQKGNHCGSWAHFVIISHYERQLDEEKPRDGLALFGKRGVCLHILPNVNSALVNKYASDAGLHWWNAQTGRNQGNAFLCVLLGLYKKLISGRWRHHS